MSSPHPPVALFDLAHLAPDQRAALLVRAEDDLTDFIEKVQPIIDAVRTQGDAALIRFAQAFDGASLTHLAVTPEERKAARAALEPAMIETLTYAAENIRRFHQAQMPAPQWTIDIRPGAQVGERVTPIDRVALYVPRGKGAFPSVTLMAAIPAVVAGVPEPILLTPPGPDGQVDAATLIAAELAGVRDIYKVGGAAAVAAAAFGTDTIARCDKIEGPGSPWFAAARRVLADTIASRLPAGPSESIIFADETADPHTAALDTLIESEHGPDSSVFLLTTSPDLAHQVREIIPSLWESLSPERARFSATVLSGIDQGSPGGIILAPNARAAYGFINDYAPEHLQILSHNPDTHLPFVRHAGEILLGMYTAGSIANYLLGPNCVLPTAGAARVHGPLGVRDFLKTTSIGRLDRTGYQAMAPHTHRFATYEGFDAHANAVSSFRNLPDDP
ncbi:MAG: histidinol dehydrogenase [Pseudomonadota bacterium]